MEIPGAPRPEDARQYVQRMREVKEISTGHRTRGKQWKAVGQHRREPAQSDDEGQKAAYDSAPPWVHCLGARDTGDEYRQERNDGVTGRVRHSNAQDDVEALTRGGQVGAGREDSTWGESKERQADERRRTRGERQSRCRSREARQTGGEEGSRLDERVRPPRRRTREPHSTGARSRKMPTLVVIGVSAVTSALVSIGALTAASSSAGAISSIALGGWWM